MTPVLDATVTPTPHRGLAAQGPVGRAVLLALAAVLGLAPVLFAVDDVALTAGAVGTPGVLTVERCVHVPSSNRHGGRWYCDGVFVPESGSPIAVDAPPESSPGDVVPARLSPARDRAVRAGATAVLGALAPIWFGLMVLAFVPWAARWARHGVVGRRFALGGAVAAGVGAVGVVVGLVAAYA